MVVLLAGADDALFDLVGVELVAPARVARALYPIATTARVSSGFTGALSAIHDGARLACSLFFRVGLGADLVELLADVAGGLVPVAELTDEALDDDIGLPMVHLVRLVSFVTAIAVRIVLLLMNGLDKLWLLGDRLDGAWNHESLGAGALPVEVVLAGTFALQHWLFRHQLALLGVIDEEVADLTDVAIGQFLVRLVKFERSTIHFG